MDEIYNNITHRNKLRIRTETTVSNDESFLDNSYQSMPNVGYTDSLELSDLKCTIERLNTELNIANAELENLNLENGRLNKKILDYERKIYLLKSVGIQDLRRSTTCTPLKLYSPQYKKHRSENIITDTPIRPLKGTITFKNFDYSSLKSTMMKKEHLDELAIMDCNGTPTKGCRNCCTPMIDSDSDLPCGEEVKPYCDMSRRKNRVVIIADQSGQGLRKKLQEILGNEYFVYLKANAHIDQILIL
ncbi:unnamed protein product [Parnassius apollo]|uniref:(apollo) hypothetical protein n=1 Tax=Parnassius apollo TaxID=110799 RepID=A0A8S3W2P1_PARAO|nr:unnamed protein product [Parnassius apollo]